MVTVIILTRDEEKHIERSINSVISFASRILVVDSGSTDSTVNIARSLGAEVVFHTWKNYATQFNWALDQLPQDTEWVLRLDADEFVTVGLADEIVKTLQRVPSEVGGLIVTRAMMFMGRMMRYGGLYPIKVLRLFRFGHARCEERWMDEHIKLEGLSINLKGLIIDHNLNNLTWWTSKHNSYASREVIDLLNIKYKFLKADSLSYDGSNQAFYKRWLKEKVYSIMPLSIRALSYFLYRYIIKLGFLDGREGLVFHVLQGFWYRFLVDAKFTEVLKFMNLKKCAPSEAIQSILNINVVDEVI